MGGEGKGEPAIVVAAPLQFTMERMRGGGGGDSLVFPFIFGHWRVGKGGFIYAGERERRD